MHDLAFAVHSVTMSDAEETTTTANAPFDNPDGDIILRSSTDHVDFHTFKLILSLMSPVFKDMFTLPQDGLGVSSVPVIPVVESSTTLESLLLLCYPAATPTTFSSFYHAAAVMEAAKKYDMQAILSRVADLAIAQFLPDRALELYALSCRFGWQHHAQTAATRALEIKDLGRPSRVFDGLRNITGFDYHRLLAYHQECGAAAQEVGKSLPYDSKKLMCATHASDMFFISNSTTPWLNEYLNSSGKELLIRPCGSTLLKSVFYNHAIIKAIEGSRCDGCKHKVFEGMDRFRALYIAQVKQVIASVSFPC
ncbi:hypothetical protein EDB19DRAFT_915438 [Suillus lakei]|nr:hypothetical protein EDB19DRAFT_915438 [Suillus lakei]